MRFNVSLRTRLTLSVIVLLIAQVMLVLFVIQRQEVNAVFEEQNNNAVLLAHNIIQENLQPFIIWDDEGVKQNIEDRIDENLVYVIFYNRFGVPFAWNDFIVEYEDTYQFSNLPQDAKLGDFLVGPKHLTDAGGNITLDILEIEMPIFAKENPTRWGSVKIGLSMEETQREIWNTRMLLLLIGFVSLLGGILGATWLSKRITTPIEKLVDGTKHISRGEFDLKIDINSQDEIGNLARSFNEMSHQLQLLRKRMEEANKRLVQVEKLASIGHISTGIAHEIRNPLTSVKLNIQKLSEKQDLDEYDRSYLDISQEAIAQIEKFIKELLNFARVPKLNLDWFSAKQIIDGSLKMMAESLDLKKVRFQKDYQKNLPQVWVDADRIRQVILNILQNSYESLDVGGTILIALSVGRNASGECVNVTISDDGKGIPEREWENVFEPFYTTKSSGIGLGLAIARRILEQHQGSIRVKDKPGWGTTFEITLPCEGEA